MKLSSLNEWLTLGANFGVIAGLVFLGLEMQQDSRLTEREIAISQADFTHGEMIRSDYLPNILTKMGGSSPAVSAYMSTYELTQEDAQRWWRYIFRQWRFEEADWIYRGRKADACEVFVLRFLDHQIFFKYTKESLDPEWVSCIESWYTEPPGI